MVFIYSPVLPLTRLCVVSALLFSPTTFAKTNDWRPNDATEQLSGIEADVNLIRSNYEVRGKVLGQADAEERFNEALTKYLLGDYKRLRKRFMYCWRRSLYMVLDLYKKPSGTWWTQHSRLVNMLW